MGLREDVEREWLEREQRIVRYCAGRMSVAEESAFEAELIEDPELASDVQLAMLMRDALQDGEPAAKSIQPRSSVVRSPWLALAAGIVIGGVGINVVRDAGGDSDVFDDVEYLALGVVRSADPQLTSTIQRVGEQSLLIVEVPAEPATDGVEIIRPGGQRQLLTGTRDEGYLRIALPPPVKPGDYVIISGEIRYSFAVESRQP